MSDASLFGHLLPIYLAKSIPEKVQDFNVLFSTSMSSFQLYWIVSNF